VSQLGHRSPEDPLTIRAVRTLAILTLFVFASSETAEAQVSSTGRQQVWTTRVAQLVKEPAGWAEAERHETGALAFSPDDKRLAVTLTHNQRVSDGKLFFSTHLLIVGVDSPETDFRQFDLTQTCGVDLTWNERGDAILVCGVILQLADGTNCAVNSPPSGYPSLSREHSPYRAWWLDSDHVVRRDGKIFDLGCRQVGNRQVELGWPISALAASKGWVLKSHSEGPRQQVVCQDSIVDLASNQPLRGWPTRKASCAANLTLAVGAEALCFNLDRRLHCRAVDGAREIPVPKQLRNYVLSQAASSSARVVAERWEADHFSWWETLLFWWVPYPGFPALPRQAMAFDLRSGTVISSWKPRIQDSRSPHIEDWPYHLALSARGELLGESGDGVLELYRLAP
jgi:hypothetical protein